MPATRCFNRIEDLVCDNEQLTQQQSDLQARLLVLEERQRAWDRTRRLRKNIIAKVDRGQTVSITSCGRSEVFGPRESDIDQYTLAVTSDDAYQRRIYS